MLRQAVIVTLLIAVGGCKGKKKEPHDRPTGGPCEYASSAATCELNDVKVEPDGPTSIVTATYVGDDVPRVAAGSDAERGPISGYQTFAYRVVVPATEADALAERLRAAPAVPCKIDRITTGTCVPMSIRSVSPPGAPDAGP